MNQQITEELTPATNSKILLGLDRIKSILAILGNPQNFYKVIHITGTNGKGSTATFIECGLIHAGYKVGKYSSPHIDKINETISLNGSLIPDVDLERNFYSIKTVQKQHNIELSPFELLTVIMFYYFKEQCIDYLVLEVGMGGENDATNVIDKPVCAIITNIALEHTSWFGNSLTAIAHEKSGIIKSSCPVIIADSSIELQDAVNAKSSNIINVLDKYDINVSLDFVEFKTDVIFREYDGGAEIENNNIEHSYKLSLFGKFQAYNFLCAFEVFSMLKIDKAAIAYAAQHTTWQGRLQLISRNPNILVDATHNDAGAKVLYETLTDHYRRDDVIIITSILADKNITEMLKYFSKIADSIIFTSINNTTRGLSAANLFEKSQESNISTNAKTYTIENPREALEFAQKTSKKLILITGSLYLLHNYR